MARGPAPRRRGASNNTENGAFFAVKAPFSFELSLANPFPYASKYPL
jgi:hypothetical protein